MEKTVSQEKTIDQFSLPTYGEIPDIGLFLEQTNKFVASYLEPLSGISITPSMISNYVKKKLIKNPVKKQYDREQIAYILFIAVAKSVLSLDEIGALIQLQKNTCDCKSAYEYFREQFLGLLRDIYGNHGELSISPKDLSFDRQLLRSTLLAVSQKIYLTETIAGLSED